MDEGRREFTRFDDDVWLAFLVSLGISDESFDEELDQEGALE